MHLKHAPLHAIANDIRTNAHTCVDYARKLCGVVKNNQSLNAIAVWDEESFMAASKRADEDISMSKGPLHGIPIIIKDNINTLDLPTSGGTPTLVGNNPGQNALVVERLFKAGAILGGKANMHELSSGGTSDNHVFGTVRNPYDVTCVPGGSSGGVAVAVAAGLVPAGLGTDTAGSARVPAALCGAVGFRPTTGRYPAKGIIPLSRSLDTVGPIAHCVQDIQILDSVLADRPMNMTRRNVSDLRIGIAYDWIEASSLNVSNAINKALDRLENAGVTLVPIELEPMRELHRAANNTVIDTEFEDDMKTYLSTYAPHVELKTLVEGIASPTVKNFTKKRLAKPGTPQDYVRAVTEGQRDLKIAWENLFRNNAIDAVAFPTSPFTALPLDCDDNVMRGDVSTPSWFYFNYTNYASTGGRPAITLPAGLSSEGLPVGLELNGLPECDEDLLAIARAVEDTLDVAFKEKATS